MSLHDTNIPRNKPLVPAETRDRIPGDSRRVNQNPEIVSINTTITEATVTGLANGQTSIIQLSFDNVQNDGTVIAVWEVSIFVNNNNIGNLLYPYHTNSTVDLSQWQIIPVSSALIPNSGLTTTPITSHVQRLVLRNISAGTVNLIINARPRYIFNRG